ncbi:hypothetical protein PGT21_011231 [Puccinia graminis f. sp. tritici]|uniref:Uncharacterized protein n=1 Tax=Puccinia graminis f. sp. tritici TaxID=56615 RepID=A0A5B0RT84_PUCGR|nr:hypothetical protein PGT21_011231 [Puccinia graminis f. sp. tritici]KAA1127754.1 hypothetical protein PGTUg99_003974 [Puccinia graminis f. sp. tritici]
MMLLRFCLLAVFLLDQAVHRSSASEMIGSADGLKEIASGSSSARSSKKWKLPKSLSDIKSNSIPSLKWRSALRGFKAGKKNSPPQVGPPPTASPPVPGSPLGVSPPDASHADDVSEAENLSHHSESDAEDLSHPAASEDAHSIPQEPQDNTPYPTHHHPYQPQHGGYDQRHLPSSDHVPQPHPQSQTLNDQALARRLQYEEYAPHTGDIPYDVVTDFLGDNHVYDHVNQHGYNYAEHSRDEEIAQQLQASLSLDPHDHHVDPYRNSYGYGENYDYPHQHGSVVPDWVGVPYHQLQQNHEHGSSDARTPHGQDWSSWMNSYGSYRQYH